MLTSPAGSIRDWGLFAAAALAPSIAMGALALRAISNEDAGVRREEGLALAAAAGQTSLELDREMSRAAQDLERTALVEERAEGIGEAIHKLAPAFAEPIVLAADRTLLYPVSSLAEPTKAPPAQCAGLVSALAAPDGEEARAAASREILKSCTEAKTPAGRWAWPLLALPAIDRSEVSPEAAALWFESHRGMLGETERAATLLEVQASTSLTGAIRDRALAALGPSGSRREAIAALLRSEDVQTALRSVAERREAPGSIVRSGPVAGALRALDDGRIAGFVVYAGSISSAIVGGALALPADTRAEVIEGLAVERGGAPLDPRRPRARRDGLGDEERLEATVEVAPALAVRLSPADPDAVTRRASKSRVILAAIFGGATALAFLLAGALFARIRAARRLSALRTDFVATVSHELRTPIASVRMLAELLDEGRVEPDEQREVIDALAREAKRLGETVERLLRFSRMEANRYEASRALVPVAGVVAASIDAFEEQSADASPVTRELDTEAEASIDASQVRMAVDNLLANARKYAPQGGPYKVTVRRERGGVAIRVTDQGPGIKRRDQRRIFEPFERGDDRLSRATEGSGIGLSLVRHVARAHGGRVSVESEPGKGATFTIWIPGRTA